MTLETLEVKQDGMTLDLLLWRRFGKEVSGLVESTLALNQDLSRIGPYLPVGTRVDVSIDEAQAPAAVKVLRLWG